MVTTFALVMASNLFSFHFLFYFILLISKYSLLLFSVLKFWITVLLKGEKKQDSIPKKMKFVQH